MSATTDTFATIQLAHIVTSRTNPRKHFHPGKLQDLADSIKASGVHQPVLVRPLPGARVADTAHMDPRPQWELVSGERRYRASELADVTSIPAMVRALSDQQVLEIQLVENLQRDDLTPLEEAEGYEALRDRPLQDGQLALTIDQIAERIGKSRSYVYGRLKLLNLGPDGRQAMQDGWLDPSTALLVARMPSHKLQAQALGNLRDYSGRVLSHRDAAGLIERQYMLKLSAAPFKITDADLMPSAGSCRDCPKRTGADPDLFADIKGADVCTDPPCYKAKTDAHQSRQLQAARESGAQIIEGREAKSLIPNDYTGRVEGYLRLDEKDDAPGREKTLRQLIGKQMEKAGITPVLVANPHRDGELIAVITHEQARDLLAAKGYEEQAAAIDAKAHESEKAAAEAQKRKDQERYETGWRWAVLEAAWEKISAVEDGMYSVPDSTIRALATQQIPSNQEKCKRLCKLLGLGTVAPSAAVHDWVKDHPEPARALALLVMYGDIEWRTWGREEDKVNQRLLDIATDTCIEVDVDAVKADIKKQHTADIKARNKARAATSAAKAPSPPLPSAAQASGVRGEAKSKGKGKKPPAAPAGPKVSAEEAMQGIAAAMQSEEAGGDSAPGETEPAVGEDADGELDGRATSPDAGAAPLVPGARVRVTSEGGMTGWLGTAHRATAIGGKWVVTLDRFGPDGSDYLFLPEELEVVAVVGEDVEGSAA